MKTRSALVYLPGYPTDIKSLVPSRALAALAGALLDAGHTTTIEDYGTLSILERIFSDPIAAKAQHLVELTQTENPHNPLHSLYTALQIRGADRAYSAVMSRLAVEAARSICAQSGIHFVGFLAENPEDYFCATRIAEFIHAVAPKVRMLAFGKFISAFGGALAKRPIPFDALCVGDPEFSVLACAERIGEPETWSTVGGVITRGAAWYNDYSAAPSLASFPAPVYNTEIYPALRDGQKIKLFEIEECRAAPPPAVYDPLNARRPRTRPVAAICDEMASLGSLHGARLFHLRGGAAPASHVSALAHELLRRRVSILYSREGRAESCVAATLPSLRASGCAALTFSVDTGSQRLHDRHYHSGLTITQIEKALRDAKHAGLYTVATLTFPTLEDDWHTRAETLRMTDRTRPDAAPVGLPDWAVEARRFRNAASVRYSIRDVGRLDTLLRRGLRFPITAPSWRYLLCDAGADGVAATVGAHRDLIDELERRGISSSVPEDVLRMALLSEVGPPAECGARLQRALVSGHVDDAAAFVEGFNAAADSRRASSSRQTTPDQSIRAAVGD